MFNYSSHSVFLCLNIFNNHKVHIEIELRVLNYCKYVINVLIVLHCMEALYEYACLSLFIALLCAIGSFHLISTNQTSTRGEGEILPVIGSFRSRSV